MPLISRSHNTPVAHSTRSRIAAGIALAALGSAALAQPHSPYGKPNPIRPNLPGPLSEEVGLKQQPALAREGTFVSAARGQAIKGKSGRWFFIFDPDADGFTLPPMVLLANLNLAALERLAERSPPGSRMLMTGQVLLYEGLNYLLAAAPPLPVRLDEPVAPASSPPAPVPASGEPAMADPTTPAPVRPVSGEPSIDEIVARLDKAAGRVAATSPQRAAAPIQPAAEPVTPTPAAAGSTPTTSTHGLVAPGVLASRRGRITRAADGAMVFTFDSGTSDGQSGPMVLLPCQNLTSIELISERSGEGATYTVTGDVQTYRGRNYLLLRSYKVNRVSDQVMPAQ